MTRVIVTLLLTYPQVREYGSFHFFVRRMARRLSVPSTSTPRRLSTDATKGAKFRHSLRQVCGYFFFFSRSEVSRHFSFFGSVGDHVSIPQTQVVNTIRPLRPEVFDYEIPLHPVLYCGGAPLPLALALPPCMAQPVNILGFSCMCMGVKTLSVMSATPSQSSL